MMMMKRPKFCTMTVQLTHTFIHSFLFFLLLLLLLASLVFLFLLVRPFALSLSFFSLSLSRLPSSILRFFLPPLLILSRTLLLRRDDVENELVFQGYFSFSFLIECVSNQSARSLLLLLLLSPPFQFDSIGFDFFFSLFRSIVRSALVTRRREIRSVSPGGRGHRDGHRERRETPGNHSLDRTDLSIDDQ